MTGTNQLIEQIYISLRGEDTVDLCIDVFDNSLSIKWLKALNDLLSAGYHLEKNYCFLGWPNSERDGNFILEKINETIAHINNANLGYVINDKFEWHDLITIGNYEESPLEFLRQERLNMLHRYFEDLQGHSGNISSYYKKADAETKWHIRQLNLLCHEFEAWFLSWRKKNWASEWIRPCQLMCWLNAPRFVLTEEDFELFGIHTISRQLGGIYLGVNKGVGKHHWEVFNDENNDTLLDALTTTALRSQVEAAGDFDIEWARDPSGFEWQQNKLAAFEKWLIKNGCDPQDPSLTIGHPKMGQIDLQKSFGTQDHFKIWDIIGRNLNVWKIRTSSAEAIYDYQWQDAKNHQIRILNQDELD